MTARIVPDGPAGRRAALEALQAGGIVAIPTDTVYGIGVGPGVPGGIEALFAAKGRPPDRAVVLLLGDAADAEAIAEPTRAGDVLAKAFWPGGLSIVLPRRPTARFRLSLAEDGDAPPTIGLRVPNHPAPRFLASALGALPTTSANRSRAPEAGTAAAIREQLGESLAVIVDAGPAPGGSPSTVADATGDVVRILRHGAIGIDVIAAVLRAAGLPEPVGR
ncbi:MAG TPA: L-threonylcarbamoyladenylate synthase [Candidatus Limnocylindrales bacterium]|nr:L-threonylcarbamoyladenylate synthase [Candidatus Limnocylindrales bacterium]